MTGEEIESVASNDCPIIPVNVGRQQTLVDGGTAAFSFWLKCVAVKVGVQSDVGDDEWLIFNSNMNVLSRTDYDLRTWKLLKATLLDETKFAIINPLTRAHMISDIFEFCRAENFEITYDFAMETIKYLEHEDKHCVWFVALTQLRLIYNNFVRTDSFKPFKKYIEQIMTVVFNRPEFSKMDDLPIGAAHSLKKLIIDASCLYGVEDCEDQSKKLFKDWYTKSTNGKHDAFSEIPLAIRDTILSQGIRKTDQEHWDHLLVEYRKYAKTPKIRYAILDALGCSKKEETLKKYLNMSLDSQKIFKIDSLRVFDSLSQNKIGFPLMEEFLRTNYNHIVEYRNDVKGILAAYIKILILSTNNRKELERVKTFIEEIRYDKDLIDQTYDGAIVTIEWYERNEPKFKEFFEKFPPSKKSKKKKSSPIFGRLLQRSPPKDNKNEEV